MNRDPNKAYYGATREEIAALGIDPDEYEANRLANQQYFAQRDAQQARTDEAGLLAAAQEAVASGELTYAEAAAALRSGGFKTAEAMLVQQWTAEEAADAADEFASELPWMNAQQYIEMSASRAQQEDAAKTADVEETKRQLRVAQVTELQSDLKSLIESTPGAHALAPKVEQQLVQDLTASGELPSTPAERAAAIEVALRKTVVLGNATESIKQQVDQEWRIHRKNNARNEGAVTAADVAAVEARWKEDRYRQLSDTTTIDLDALKPQPSAAETTAAIAERYREKTARSDGFHRTVAEIRKAGEEGSSAPGSAGKAERDAYREAVERAEAEAGYGTTEIKSGYGAGAPDPNAKPSGFGPDGTWPDELGPAL